MVQDDLRFSSASRATRMAQATLAALIATPAILLSIVVGFAFDCIRTLPPMSLLRATRNCVEGLIALVWYVHMMFANNWKRDTKGE